ncbi:hypothetical protein ACGF0J_11580 [Nonomuraea sp. NPDC047897]
MSSETVRTRLPIAVESIEPRPVLDAPADRSHQCVPLPEPVS